MSYWGKVDSKKVIERGIISVSTSRHGGFMISKGVASKKLSEAARKLGVNFGGYLCYEEDILANIIFLEIPESRKILLDKLEDEKIITTLSAWVPDYLIERNIKLDQDAYSYFLQRKLDAKLRSEKSSDLIVSAIGIDDKIAKVYTADDKEHFVDLIEYRNLKGIPLLSKLNNSNETHLI